MTKTSLFAPLAALSLLAAGTAPAFAKAQDDQPAAASAKSERKICKNIARSESRMTERVCLTKTEWRKLEDQR
jgi:invasion protein IalB